MKMEQTEFSEMLAYKIQMPGNYPEEAYNIFQYFSTKLHGVLEPAFTSIHSLRVTSAASVSTNLVIVEKTSRRFSETSEQTYYPTQCKNQKVIILTGGYRFV
jgi:hypothetical protein